MRRRERFSPFGVGLAAILLIVVATYFAFAKDIPFTKGYEMTAVFEDSSAIAISSPVRIAGVEVGKVTKVEPAGEGSTASAITMQIEEEALPLHENATLKIRPRIFLEGNFFVDVRPGTPSSPELPDGGTIPSTQTSAPVQIDQVLATLKSDTREDLQQVLSGFGDAIGGAPRPGEDGDQDSATRGETAGQSLNDSLRDSGDALRGTAVVNDALQGTKPHDLSKLIEGFGKVSKALDSRESQLQDLITNFNVTTGALAAEQGNLRRTLRVLPEVLEAANPALDELNAALPPTRAFAREILPGVRETPATIAAALPWIAQTRALVAPDELQGLVRDLRPAVDDLAQFTDGTVSLLPEVDRFNLCVKDNLLPTGDVVIDDGALSSGVENYRELFQSLVGFSGESQNFDGNGVYTRFQTGSGDQTVETGPLPGAGPLFANALRRPLGSRPVRPAEQPVYNRSQPCFTQRQPDLNSARTGGGP